MTLPELAAAVQELSDASCDDKTVSVLTEAAWVLARCTYHGPCLRCAERAAEVAGYCRPCYQSKRRAALAERGRDADQG